MSRENVDAVKLAYERAYAERSVEGVRDFFAPDFTFHNRPEFPGPRDYRMEEIERLWSDLDDTYSDFSLVPDAFEEAGDYVIVTVRTSAELKASSARVEGAIWHVWHVPNGRPQEAWAYGSRREALQAVGPHD